MDLYCFGGVFYMGNVFPLTRHFRATNVYRAFVLNALATAAIAALAIEFRMELDLRGGPMYGYVAQFLGERSLNRVEKMGVVFVAAFFGALLVYSMLHATVAFGGGMLVNR